MVAVNIITQPIPKDKALFYQINHFLAVFTKIVSIHCLFYYILSSKIGKVHVIPAVSPKTTRISIFAECLLNVAVPFDGVRVLSGFPAASGEYFLSLYHVVIVGIDVNGKSLAVLAASRGIPANLIDWRLFLSAVNLLKDLLHGRRDLLMDRKSLNLCNLSSRHATGKIPHLYADRRHIFSRLAVII